MKIRRLAVEWSTLLFLLFVVLLSVVQCGGNSCLKAGGGANRKNSAIRLQTIDDEFPAFEIRLSMTRIPTGWEHGNWLSIWLGQESVKIVAISTFMGTHSLVSEVKTVKLSEMHDLSGRIEAYFDELPFTCVDGIGVICETGQFSPFVKQLQGKFSFNSFCSVMPVGFDVESAWFLASKACLPELEALLVIQGLESRFIWIDDSQGEERMKLVSSFVPVESFFARLDNAFPTLSPTTPELLSRLWKRKETLKGLELELLKLGKRILRVEMEKFWSLFMMKVVGKLPPLRRRFHHSPNVVKLIIQGETWSQCEMLREMTLEFVHLKMLGERWKVEIAKMPDFREFELYGATVGACCLRGKAYENE